MRFAVITLLAVVLTGCMVGPNFHKLSAPPTNRYTEKPLPLKTVSAPRAGESGQAQYFIAGDDIPTQWWTLFRSPALDELIRTGLNNSPNLQAAVAALKQAQETEYAQIGASLFPNASLQLAGQRQRYSSAQLGGGSSSIFNLYNASVNVTYTLDVFGGLRRQIEGLAAQTDYQHYQLGAAYLALTSNIVTTTVSIASLQAQIQATHALIEEEQAQLDVVEKQFKLGGVSGANVLTQVSQVAQTRATLPPLQQNLTKARDALAVLVGALPSEAQLPQFDLDKLCLPIKLPVILPSSLVQQRPDVLASEALLHQASARVGVATANLLPQFNFTGGYGYTNTSTGNLFTNANNIWSYAGQLLQPVFNAGSLRAKRRAAIDAYNQAFAQYKQTVLQAFQNVADTLQALQNDALALQAQEQAEVAARDSLHITSKQFRLGGVSYLNLLTAQQQYQQAVINRIQAQAARFSDTAALFQALGGGWWKPENKNE